MQQNIRGTSIVLAIITFIAGNAVAMDEIVVEATRRARDVQEVPIAVTPISRDQISKLQIDTTQDIGDAIPNLQTYTVTAGAQALQLHARGASVQNPGFNTSESPVGFYVDDVYRGRLGSINLNLTDIERIEVLRGPQATLYGRNTLAGAVKVFSRTPDDEFWADASVGYGNYETFEGKGSIGGPIIEGSLAASFAFGYDKRDDGWINNNNTGGNVGEYENKIGRAKLHYYGMENFDATLTIFGVDAENDGYNGIPYVPFGQSKPSSPIGDFYDNFSPANANYGDTDQSGFTVDASYEFGFATLRSITALTDIDDDFGFDLAGGGFNGVAGDEGLLITSDSNSDQWSQEFQLLGASFNDRLEWITGFFYMNEDGNQKYTGRLDPFFIDFQENTDTETDSYAVFAEGTWSFTDRLRGTAGLRWSKDKKDFEITCSAGPGGTNSCADSPIANPPFTVKLDEDYDEWTPKFGLDYQVTDNLLTYASVSKGFQAGGFQTLCFGNLDCADSDYDPQTVWSYELGFKTDLLNDTLRLNTAIFYAAYEDIQQTVITPAVDAGGIPTGGVIFPTDNVDDVDVWGIELETYWSPTDGLNFFGSLGYMDADEVSFSSDLGPPIGVVQIDRDLPSNPDVSARVGFDYTRDLNSALQVFFGADMIYSDNYFSEVGNDLEIGDYTRGNGFLGLGRPDGRWQVVGTVKNISDEDDNVSGIFAAGFTNIRTPLPPREYMLTLKVAY